MWSEITLEQLTAEDFSTNPDFIVVSASFIWGHGAGVTSVDFLFSTFSPCSIPLSQLLSFACVLGLACRLSTEVLSDQLQVRFQLC